MKNILCTLCLRDWRFHAKPVFFFIIFSRDLCFNTLIIELLYISLIISQILGVGTLQKAFVGVSRERWGVSLVCVASE